MQPRPGKLWKVMFPTLHKAAAGDTIEQIGNRLCLIHAGLVIAYRDLDFDAATEVPAADFAGKTGDINHVYFFRETQMPGVMATMTGASFNEGTGAISFTFSDGSGMTFSDSAAVEAECGYDVDPDFPKRVLAMRAVRKSHGLADLSVMVGGSCAVDLNADTPISVDDPV